MDNVNEWSTEYSVKVGSISELAESPHSWDKKVLNITPIKKNNNYRFRVGLQMFRMKTNEHYPLVVEVYNRDYITWERQEIYVNGTGMWVESNNTTKYQYHYGSSNTLYYSKTLIRFKKTSSSPPIFVYFTIHYDDKSGDLNTYPKEFKNQIYLVAYGVEGLTDHVDSEVYNAHEAFEIDKTKMKMLVPLGMNNQKLLNYELKFGNLFKIIKCYAKFLPQRNFSGLFKKSDNQTLSFSDPIIIHSITLFNQQKFGSEPYISIVPKGLGFRRIISLDNLPSQSSLNDVCSDLPMMCIFNTEIGYIAFYNVGNLQFDVDIVISYM